MRGILDESVLEGIHEARITFRPARRCVPVSNHAMFFDTVRYQCQLWSGANAPLLPVHSDGSIPAQYAHILAGSAVDSLLGLKHRNEIFNLTGVRVSGHAQRSRHGGQLAVALLKYHEQTDYRSIQVVELETTDPWQGIYAACLGLLPDRPDCDVLKDGGLLPDLTFEDFVNVDRTTAVGSVEDLLTRLRSDAFGSPRALSMVHLAYGNSGSSHIRSRTAVLPEPNYSRFDAGPNVVVICSPGSIEDLTLLWNLRCAQGDVRPLPIGLPISEANLGAIHTLSINPDISRNGISTTRLYVTSASLSTDAIRELLPVQEGLDFDIASYTEMLDLGDAAGWNRSELLSWSGGVARFVPCPPDKERELFDKRAVSRTARMYVDIRITDDPFPEGNDVRIDSSDLGNFYAGGHSNWLTPPYRTEPREIVWPNRLLMARSVASARGLDLRESEPGRAARVALNGLGDLYEVSYLAHAPLLGLLEEMAARQGFGWYKNRVRATGREPSPVDAVPPTTDSLPERSYGEFKKVLGNNDRATKFWLLWAEKGGLIVKGFQLQCDVCLAKQWVPVAAFAPPIVCRGCAEDMDTPFGSRPNIEFRYRLSERLRRVYEHDAMGHLLAARFFKILFDTGRRGRTIGVHPGMEALRKGGSKVDGEADVLLFTKAAEFVPVEVKRTSSGFNEGEVAKLDILCDILDSPWSAAVICEYGRDSGPEFAVLEDRSAGVERFRVILSYDTILEPYPFWGMGDDPFEWKPLSLTEIQTRESEFVETLAGQFGKEPFDWLTHSMMRRDSTSGPAA